MFSRMGAIAAASVAAGAAATDIEELILGVSYGPIPIMSVEEHGRIRQDDWFCDEAVRMWGKSGRGDLRLMRLLGANMVRLYGNNPANDHTNFLDEAHSEGLSVAPGMSDYPYTQMVPGRCLDTDYVCFDQVKTLYKTNLQKGFLRPDGSYHPSLKYMNILNEADIKMPVPKNMARALITAFDGMLDAEREVGVTGKLINFTATFSFGICSQCEQFNGNMYPALGQMWTLEDAMLNPAKYGYSPRNDISAAYRSRWTHSFNTQNPATDMQPMFFGSYSEHFTTTPVYIGEYHRTGTDQRQDLRTVLDLARNNPLFLGISFFQFQVAMWKDGAERLFGMFDVSDQVLTKMDYFDQSFDIHCLKGREVAADHGTIHAAVAEEYGGPGVTSKDMACEQSAESLPVSMAGFMDAVARADSTFTARYVERVVQHLGGVVPANDQPQLLSFAEKYTPTSGQTFGDLAEALAGQWRPEWAKFDTAHARCAADRGAQPRTVGEAIGWACANAKTFTCEDIPDFCKQSPYRSADWVFSRLFKELGPNANPLTDCVMNGAAIFASSEIYGRWTGSAECLEGGVAPVLTTAAPTTRTVATTTQSSQTVSSTTAPPASTSSSSSSAPSGSHHDVVDPGATVTATTTSTTTGTDKLFLERDASLRAALPAAMLLLLVAMQV